MNSVKESRVLVCCLNRVRRENYGKWKRRMNEASFDWRENDAQSIFQSGRQTCEVYFAISARFIFVFSSQSLLKKEISTADHTRYRGHHTCTIPVPESLGTIVQLTTIKVVLQVKRNLSIGDIIESTSFVDINNLRVHCLY